MAELGSQQQQLFDNLSPSSQQQQDDQLSHRQQQSRVTEVTTTVEPQLLIHIANINALMSQAVTPVAGIDLCSCCTTALLFQLDGTLLTTVSSDDEANESISQSYARQILVGALTGNIWKLYDPDQSFTHQQHNNSNNATATTTTTTLTSNPSLSNILIHCENGFICTVSKVSKFLVALYMHGNSNSSGKSDSSSVHAKDVDHVHIHVGLLQRRLTLLVDALQPLQQVYQLPQQQQTQQAQ